MDPTSPEPQPAERRSRRTDLLLALGCAAAAFLLYLPSLGHGFVVTWDDGDYIVRNALIRELSPAMLRDAFAGATIHYFHPLTWLSYAIDHRLWGEGPFGFHLGNALLHAGSAALAYGVALGILGSDGVRLRGRTLRLAALGAALAWALHPLRVEAVSWAAERKGVLCAFLALGALLAYLAHVRSGAPFWRSRPYAAALVLFALSVLAKTSLVTLPLAFLVLDAWPLRRPGRGRGPMELAEKGPLLAVAVAIAAFFAATSNAIMTQSMAEAGLVSRGLVALRGAWAQALLVAWPSGLSPFYLHPGAVGPGDLSWSVPAAAAIALTIAAVAGARRWPGLAVAWLCWLVTLAPGLSATMISATWMADRFTYLPALAPTLLAAGVAAAWAERQSAAIARGAVAAFVAAVLVLAGLSVRQERFWRDDVALWSRPIDLEPRRSGRVYAQRAYARELAGDLPGAVADLDVAIEVANERRFSGVGGLYARRGGLRRTLGQVVEADEDERRAAEMGWGP
jgi:hypothetical protein